MAVNIVISTRKMFSQLKNGEDFSLNTGDFATHLLGSVGGRFKYLSQIDISWKSQASSSNLFSWTRSGNIFTFTRETGSFIADGWAISDTMDVNSSTPGGPWAATVQSVQDETIVIDSATLAIAEPGASGAGASFVFYGTTNLTGLIYRYGIIENADSTNFASLLDGNDQAFYINDLGLGGPRDTSFQTGESLGSIAGWNTGTIQARYVSNPSTYVQRFEIEHEFTLIPYWQDGDSANLLNGINPDILKGINSLKYVINYEFRNSLSNINTQKVATDDFQLGDVGGFGENFNGFDSDYQILSTTFQDTLSAVSAEGIIIDKTTTVSITVDKISGAIAASTPFNVFISRLPSQADYTDNTDTFNDVWLYETKRQVEGAAAVAGTIISQLVGTIVGGNLVITFNVDYSASQQLLLNDDTEFIIGVEIADDSLSTINSDKVMLLASLTNYVKDSDIPGLMTLDKFNIFNHPNDISGSGFTDYKGWIEDGVVIDFRAHMDITNQAVITGARQRLVAYNSTTGELFELDSFEFDLGTSVFVPSGSDFIQKINNIGTRGFNIPDADQFNLAVLKSDILTGTDQFYDLQIGFKLSWQDWIALPGADAVFYSVSNPNNGLNEKSSNYSMLNGYEIHAWIEFDIEKDGVTTIYRFSSAPIDVYDYDKDANSPSEDWSVVIQLKTEDGLTNTNGKILSDQKTLFRGLWTWASGPVVDASDFWAIHRLEENNSFAGNPYELSSIRTNRTDMPLIPLTGESGVKISLGSGGEAGLLITECYIDNNVIDLSKQWDVSVRLGSISGVPPVPADAKLMEDDTPKLTEGAGEYKILE